jgi:hypothetical protein
MDTFSKLQYHLINNNGQTTCYVHNEKGDTIAVMRRDDAPSTKMQGQWAKEIVNRYNTHDSLIEALKEITRQYEAMAEDFCKMHKIKI